MKKFLSLVLALVMTMSLVTISAGAKDFTDDDKITYEEAVNVISTIGVVDGYADGSFNPQGSLTRGAAAKIICNMILGPTTAAELHADTAPYKDVPVNHTFAGYIAYCAKEGIISGYADGTFRPAGTLTGYAFMKMLLGALGYDAQIEGYTGANWSINVAKQAINVGLNKSLEGDFNGIKAVNREEAALYAFNTLKSDLVEYDTTISTTINGQTVTVGNSQAKAMQWQNSATRKTNIKADNYVQFAEQYFTKLKLTEDVDVFGRPDREWEYDGKDIGTYVNYDLLVEEYTEEVSGKDLYDLLGKSTIEDYDTTVYIDGVSDSKIDGNVFEDVDMNKNNKDGVGATGDGVLTQVFVDTDSKDITIAIINTYLAIASTDYSEKKDEVSFDVYAVSKKSGEFVKTQSKDKTVEDVVKGVKVSGDDFEIEDIEEDDAYLVNIAEGEIQIMNKAEIVADTEITSFKTGSNVTAGGTKYGYADTAEYDVEVLDQYTDTKVNLKDLTYNIYLDQYGYLIGIDLVEEADNYVFITGSDDGYSNLSNKTIDANAIFIDGTMETIKVKTDKGVVPGDSALVNTWFTYTVDKNGVYTLKAIPVATTTVDFGTGKIAQFATKNVTSTGATDTYEIDKKHISLPGKDSTTGEFAKVYGNDATVYLTAELKAINTGDNVIVAIIDDVSNVTTGVKNANLKTFDKADAIADAKTSKLVPTDAAYGVYTLYKNNGYIIAAVVVGEDDAASKNLVYAHKGSVELESYDKTADEWTWTRKVVSGGEEIEITEVGDALTYLDTMKKNNWYQVKYNAKGEVISVEPVATALSGYEYITKIKLVEAAINDKDTVLYEESFDADTPEMKGSTLYVSTADKEGFFVDENVKIVLIQTNNNKETTSFETGVDTLEDIVTDLNEDNNGKYDYTISAILEEGAATVVVIYDETNNYTRPDGSKKDEDSEVVVAIANGKITVSNPKSEGVDAVAVAIVDELNKLGYDDVEVQVAEGKVSGAVAVKNSIKYAFDVEILPVETPAP